MDDDFELDDEVDSCDTFDLSEDMNQDNTAVGDDNDEGQPEPPGWLYRDALAPSTKESLVRTTTPVITKFERVRMLGMRAAQLSMGAHSMVEPGSDIHSLSIARREMESNKIPLCLRRRHPNGSYEDWNVSELTNPSTTNVADILSGTTHM